ncbi:hypothetical protein HDV04_005014 [Boothiomyces sp. JEL0838]|nr:hypothetical protein HDV04_005014 [Boothiomyces sp. JEL0838]
MSDFNVPYRIILLMALPPLGFLIYDWYNYYTNAEYFVFWTVEIVVLWIVFIAMVTLYSLCLIAINPRIKKDQTPKSLVAMYRFMLLFSVVNIIIWLPFLLSDTYFVYIVQSTKSFPGPFYFTYVHPFFSASINMKGFFHAIVIYFGTCQTPTKQSTPKIEPESTTLPFAMPKLDVSDATAHDSGQGSSFDVLSVDQLLEHQVFNHSNLDILNSDKPTLTSSRYPSVVKDVGNSVKIPTGELGESYVQPQNEPASYTPSLALGDSVIF